MSNEPFTLHQLREAFASIAEHGGSDAEAVPAEQIWRAVHGELSPDQVAKLAEEALSCPQTAEAWRLARELHLAATSDQAAVVRPTRWVARAWAAGLAAAAVLVLGVAVTVLQPEAPRYRHGGGQAIHSLLDQGLELPRDHCLLRWSAGPEGSCYALDVADDEARTLLHVDDLEQPKYLVPAERLAHLPAGAAILWRVSVTLPDGSVHHSTAFAHRVQ